jgi:hypothetical protein
MTDLPAHTETLNELLARKASEWDAEHDLPTIVAALREQRERWNIEQSSGSGKRVPSTKVETGRQVPTQGSMKHLLKGLKL